jgi:hypothetical protein
MLNENSGGGSATRTFDDNPGAKQTSNQSEALRIREGFVLPVNGKPCTSIGWFRSCGRYRQPFGASSFLYFELYINCSH